MRSGCAHFRGMRARCENFSRNSIGNCFIGKMQPKTSATGASSEVAGPVGMRVEDPRVFNDTHRLIIELVRSGQVQGLRVDHIDGLADPNGYLEHLRQAVGPTRSS